jgi:hypothetical protein
MPVNLPLYITFGEIGVDGCNVDAVKVCGLQRQLLNDWLGLRHVTGSPHLLTQNTPALIIASVHAKPTSPSLPYIIKQPKISMGCMNVHNTQLAVIFGGLSSRQHYDLGLQA